MEAIDCEVVRKDELRAMSRHVDKLRGQLEEARRWNIVQTIIILMLATALTYTLIQGGI